MTKATSLHDGLYISDFSYELPEDKIAAYPLERRDASKLLVWESGKIREGHYAEIGNFLPSPCLLVFNDSRVVEARILFQKPTGGQIEIFCLEPFVQTIADGMKQTKSVLWTCLIGGASKWKRHQVLKKEFGHVRLEARFVEKRTDDFVIEFSWTPHELPFASLLHQMGSIPLPPYLKRSADISDTERYQTVYAKESGSVAAPTAGLHFNKELIQNLAFKGIEPLYLTLHVGAGTFMPVKTDRLSEHHMHEEFIEVRAVSLEKLISKLHEPVIAVGTTSLRTLETLYWLGLKISKHKGISAEQLSLNQEYPYQENANIPVAEALRYLLDRLKNEPEEKLITKTQLFIVPGYSFKIVRGLITNFHQPHSTLLLLVAAFIGPSWKSAYTFALNHEYRFLSYGDGCLFLP
ncbi:MAG TPA: S-adenosylmethionine:tRNA ribosyltransferase-isomerase [Puia sp.]|nr:S-adenosylmethionine:tRNA ribosyltransferase-isomerase [Puia sp.]